MADLMTTIIGKVIKRASIPSSQQGYQNSDLLSFAQDALDEVVYPLLVAELNEEFTLINDKVPFRSSTNTVNFPDGVIPWPARAYGRNLREIKYIEDLSDGKENVYNVPMVPLDDEDLMVRPPRNAGRFGFYILSDGIKILGDANALTGSIRLTYPLKPARLIYSDTASAGIDAINWNTVDGAVFTLDTVGMTDFTTAIPDATTVLVDIVRKSTGATLFLNVSGVRTGTAFTSPYLTADDVTSLAGFQQGGFLDSGNALTPGYSADLMVIPANTTPYSPIPPELEPYFVLAIVDRYLEAQGDTEGIAVNQLKMKQAYDKAVHILGRRMTGEAKTIVNRRGPRRYMNGQRAYRW
jgi:hypothetical protein